MSQGATKPQIARGSPFWARTRRCGLRAVRWLDGGPSTWMVLAPPSDRAWGQALLQTGVGGAVIVAEVADWGRVGS